jgi:lysophospholipid acyltransferase (LPLAT)-like uncharacterized protein
VRPLKRVLRNETFRRLICWLGAQYIRLVHATGTWTVVGGEIPRRFWDAERPFILCFWHGRLMMMHACWQSGRLIHTLTSQHPDGQLIARTTAHLGIRTVQGSSTRGGSGALRALLRILEGGESIGLTPDGPHGPRMRAGDGIVTLARLSGAPIVPVAFGIDRRRVLSSWDRFVVALPFGRGVFVWGEPIEVARDIDAAGLDARRRQVEDAINAVTEKADRLVGFAPIEPAPAEDGRAS